MLSIASTLTRYPHSILGSPSPSSSTWPCVLVLAVPEQPVVQKLTSPSFLPLQSQTYEKLISQIPPRKLSLTKCVRVALRRQLAPSITLRGVHCAHSRPGAGNRYRFWRVPSTMRADVMLNRSSYLPGSTMSS